MIAIFDYGAGNLRSVENTLAELGAEYRLIRAADEVRRAAKIILPGVGHFGQMLRALAALGVRDALRDRLAAGVPFLGICLGLQALFESSEEAPELRGLGCFPGVVRRFAADVRVPHMGWDNLERRKPSRLLAGLEESPYVYFAHSYYAPAGAFTAAACTYGVPYTAVLEADNLFGVQFHPEKSGPIGLRMVANFLAL